jgi:hypothetical protein
MHAVVVREWLGHIRALAVGIGPRGSTREGERRGAAYAAASFRRSGLKPRREGFLSARSGFHPHSLGMLLWLAAFAVFPIHRPITAGVTALVTLLVIVSELQEMSFRGNLLRLLVPKAESQNIWAVVPPRAAHRRDVLLVAHMDTQRTPLIFRTHGWMQAWARFNVVAFTALVWQAVITALAVFLPLPWAWYATIPSAVCALLLASLYIEAEYTPFTRGANDNASGVGLALTMAARLAKKPLRHTRVFLVVTGCEEAGHYGMIDFYRKHRPELKDPRAIVLDTIGCAGPNWGTREGVIVPIRSDPGLQRMAERLADAHPEWGARSASLSGGSTEVTDAMRFGVPAICIGGMRKDGVVPYWHQVQDTFDKIDGGALQRAWDFTWALVQEIDNT